MIIKDMDTRDLIKKFEQTINFHLANRFIYDELRRRNDKEQDEEARQFFKTNFESY